MELTPARNSETIALWRVAQTLGRRAPKRKPPLGSGRALPPLLFVTDPQRTLNPAAVAERLPQGCGVIYRAFGAPDALDIARTLRRIADRRGLTLLVGADEALGTQAGADGLHLPERLVAGAERVRARRPGWLITGAAHDARALNAAAQAQLDAALLSPAFLSRSSSARRPLGPARVSALIRHAALPVYALGGINGATARRLLDTGAAGFAVVEALAGSST